MTSEPKSVNIMWFRNDLRVKDNTALLQACLNGPVVAVYLISVAQWRKHHMADIKIDFIHRSLAELSRELGELNIPLLIREIDYYRQAASSITEVALAHSANAVFWNREYLINELERDVQTQRALGTKGISSNSYDDALILAPGQVTTGSGTMYKVFTPFYRNWIEKVNTFTPLVQPRPCAQRKLKIQGDPMPKGDEETLPEPSWPAGELAAQDRLASFTENSVHQYVEDRDTPLIDGTSQLSPYLSIGAISPRQCLELASKYQLIPKKEAGAKAWIRQLGWRDFYNHLVVSYPELVKGEPFIKATKNIPWADNEAGFTAWATGQTGQPFVDAGMRQLNQTGWMHNRLRMVVAMFLTKNLFIHWRQGEQYFLEHLVDGDFALNNSGWQWSASTGTDAAPYFRVFNPFSQSQRFDPHGEFIRSFVPELKNIPSKALHDPAKLEKCRPSDYPKLIVDIKVSRKEAINKFSEILNSQSG